MPEVRLVGPAGEQVGIVRVEDALRLAQEADLDLVEVAPDARPPVCKLMDYGKYKYEADMKAREARRNQANTVLKEIRFRLKIDPHDYGTKKGHVERFLKAGDKVKVMIMFRGREQSRPEMGLRLLQRLAEDVAELGYVESAPRQDGRNMIMVLGPTKKKSEARNAQRKRDAEKGSRGRSSDGADGRAQPPQAAAPGQAAEAPESAPAAPAKAAPQAAAPQDAPAPSAPRTTAARASSESDTAPSSATEPGTATPAAEKSSRPAATPKPTPRPAPASPAQRAAPRTPRPAASRAARPATSDTPRPAAKPKPSARATGTDTESS